MSDEKVVPMFQPTQFDPDSVLENNKGKFKDVLLIGWTPEGNIKLVPSKDMPVNKLNLLLDKVKFSLISGGMGQT